MKLKEYTKAKELLPKLREAERIVKTWEEWMKTNASVAEHTDVTEIGDDGSFKGKPKEVPRVARTG